MADYRLQMLAKKRSREKIRGTRAGVAVRGNQGAGIAGAERSGRFRARGSMRTSRASCMAVQSGVAFGGLVSSQRPNALFCDGGRSG